MEVNDTVSERERKNIKMHRIVREKMTSRESDRKRDTHTEKRDSTFMEIRLALVEFSCNVFKPFRSRASYILSCCTSFKWIFISILLS